MNNKDSFTNNEFVNSLCTTDYLVVPISVLRSMPQKWRRKLIDYLKVIPEQIDLEDIVMGPYSVGLRANKGKFTFDYLAKSDMLFKRKKKLPWYKRIFN